MVLLGWMVGTVGAETDFPHGPDSMPREGGPEGKVTRHELKSEVFAGAIREYFVYVPAQYDGRTPVAVMVFQDGHAFVKRNGEFRVPVVFDNLIHEGVMPVTWPL